MSKKNELDKRPVLISANGRLTALTTTNRIEAMDAAINLRQVAQLLEQERSSSSLRCSERASCVCVRLPAARASARRSAHSTASVSALSTTSVAPARK